MSDELHVVSRMARLDAIDADRVAIRGVARLAPVEIVHRERRVTGYLVQALAVRHGLLHRVLIVEDLVAAHYRLHAAGKTQAPETIVEYLIELEGGRGVIGDFHACRQTVEDAIATEYRMALGGNQHARLGVPEYVVLLKDTYRNLQNISFINLTMKVFFFNSAFLAGANKWRLVGKH